MLKLDRYISHRSVGRTTKWFFFLAAPHIMNNKRYVKTKHCKGYFSLFFIYKKKRFYQNDVIILNFSTYFCCNFSFSALSLFPCSLWTIP